MWFILALIAAIAYALLWVLARVSRGMPSTVVTAAQFIPAPFILFAVTRSTDFPWSAWWWWAYLLLPFLFVPVATWAATYALHRAEVSLLKPLFGLSSILTLLTASLFFGEHVSVIGMTGIGVIVAGLLFLYHGRWQEWRNTGPWIMLAVVLFFGVNAAVVAAVIHRFPHVFAISSLVASGSLLMNAPFALRDLPSVRWSWCAVVILCSMMLVTLVQDISTLVAFTLGPSSYVIAVKRTSVLFAAFIGYVFLHERDQSLPRLLLASGIVVGGVIMLAMG